MPRRAAKPADLSKRAGRKLARKRIDNYLLRFQKREPSLLVIYLATLVLPNITSSSIRMVVPGLYNDCRIVQRGFKPAVHCMLKPGYHYGRIIGIPTKSGGFVTTLENAEEFFKTPNQNAFLLLHPDQMKVVRKYFCDPEDDPAPGQKKRKKEDKTTESNGQTLGQSSGSQQKDSVPDSAQRQELAKAELGRRQSRESHPYTLHASVTRDDYTNMLAFSVVMPDTMTVLTNELENSHGYEFVDRTTFGTLLAQPDPRGGFGIEPTDGLQHCQPYDLIGHLITPILAHWNRVKDGKRPPTLNKPNARKRTHDAIDVSADKEAVKTEDSDDDDIIIVD